MTESGYEIGRNDTGLTKRERQVLGLLVQGKNLAEIGRELGTEKKPLSRQRVHQLVNALERKKVVMRNGEQITVVVGSNS